MLQTRFDLMNFTQEDMHRCAIDIRSTSSRATSMEEVANRIVRYLYENCVDPETGNSACALVRLFKTHPYKELPVELQEAARGIIKGNAIAQPTKCLTLMATAGDEPQWNSRDGSTGHKAIPLVSEDFVQQIPMISRLIKEFGLEINTVLEPMPGLLIDSERKIHSTFIFHVPTALGSPYIPAQTGFVVPYQIKSVLGFGGLLSSGNLYVVLMFVKNSVPQETASLFKWISTYTWVALTAFDKDVFSGSGNPF